MKFFKDVQAPSQSISLDINQQADENTNLSTLDEVAAALGVSKRFVQSLVARKMLPVIRIGKRCTRFEMSRVMAAIRRYELIEMGR